MRTTGTWLSLALAAWLTGCASPPPPIKRAPPAPIQEAPGSKPGPDYFWKPGRWAWSPSLDDYSWDPGRWERERTNLLWLPGCWERQGEGWVWREETWEEKGKR